LTQAQSTSRRESLSLRRMFPDVIAGSLAARSTTQAPPGRSIKAPHYLTAHYWWAYVHPRAVWLFERQWLVNLILWGNYAKLRNSATAALGNVLPGATLQVACVYGDLTGKLSQRVAAADGRLDVVDVLPVQLQNLRKKLPSGAPVRLLAMDAADLNLPDASYDRALLFFLLHEQPSEHRERTLSEVFRVVRPGGEIVIVDYALPRRWHPLRYFWRPLLAVLEAVRARSMASRDCALAACGRAERMAQAILLRRALSANRHQALRRSQTLLVVLQVARHSGRVLAPSLRGAPPASRRACPERATSNKVRVRPAPARRKRTVGRGCR
jgi:ubiquinone/menaquinone biosynthesis C-methylase UbiE